MVQDVPGRPMPSSEGAGTYRQLVRYVPATWLAELREAAMKARRDYFQERPPHTEEFAIQTAAHAVAHRVLELIDREGMPPREPPPYFDAERERRASRGKPAVIVIDGAMTTAQRDAFKEVVEAIVAAGGVVDAEVAATLAHLCGQMKATAGGVQVSREPEHYRRLLRDQWWHGFAVGAAAGVAAALGALVILPHALGGL